MDEGEDRKSHLDADIIRVVSFYVSLQLLEHRPGLGLVSTVPGCTSTGEHGGRVGTLIKLGQESSTLSFLFF